MSDLTYLLQIFSQLSFPLKYFIKIIRLFWGAVSVGGLKYLTKLCIIIKLFAKVLCVLKIFFKMCLGIYDLRMKSHYTKESCRNCHNKNFNHAVSFQKLLFFNPSNAESTFVQSTRIQRF